MTASCPVTVAGSQDGLRINEAPSKVMWLKIIYRLVKDMLVIISNFWLLGFKNCGPIIFPCKTAKLTKFNPKQSSSMTGHSILKMVSVLSVCWPVSLYLF